MFLIILRLTFKLFSWWTKEHCEANEKIHNGMSFDSQHFRHYREYCVPNCCDGSSLIDGFELFTIIRLFATSINGKLLLSILVLCGLISNQVASANY